MSLRIALYQPDIPGNTGTGMIEAIVGVMPETIAPGGDPNTEATYNIPVDIPDIYEGANDASRVPAEWHGWLHHTVDVPPTEEDYTPREWQKPHRPNFTGTPNAWRPRGSPRSARPAASFRALRPSASRGRRRW